MELYKSPVRILTDENKALREKIEKYESTAAREVITIDGKEFEGTCYGNKLALDEPLTLIRDLYNKQLFSLQFQVPCPINSLVELLYKIEHNVSGSPAYMIGNEAKISIGRPGNTKPPHHTGSGRETVGIGNNSTLEVSVENETGIDIILTIELNGWETSGNR